MRFASILGALCLLAPLFPGCNTARKATSRPPTATATAGGTSISQDGAAAAPASANTTTTQTAATIPPGVAVTAHADGSLTWMTAAPLSIVTTRTAEQVTGPAAYPPPALPSPADEARGWGVKAFYLAALACAIGAGLCVWRAYPLAAICFGAGALALPILANFFGGMSATVAGVACVALAVGLFIAYKVTARSFAPEPSVDSV